MPYERASETGAIGSTRPARYDVITMQVNITIKPGGETMRWTIATRDPLTHVELSRCSAGPMPYARAMANVEIDIAHELRTMLHLGGHDMSGTGSRPPITIDAIDAVRE